MKTQVCMYTGTHTSGRRANKVAPQAQMVLPPHRRQGYISGEWRSRSPARLLCRVMTVHKMQREDKESKGSTENGGRGGGCPDFRRPGLERRTSSALNSSRPTIPRPTSIAARALGRFFPAAGRGITPPSISLYLSNSLTLSLPANVGGAATTTRRQSV